MRKLLKPHVAAGCLVLLFGIALCGVGDVIGFPYIVVLWMLSAVVIVGAVALFYG